MKMLKYIDTKVVFQEIPEEITLAINISGCTIQCPDCHSKYLWENIGESLNRDSLCSLIDNNKGITCIAFMGGDHNVKYLQSLFHYVKIKYPKLKVAWYSGKDRNILKTNVKYLDYIKTGPYIKDRGSLSNKSTNQRMYKVQKFNSGINLLTDITDKFWKNEHIKN